MDKGTTAYVKQIRDGIEGIKNYHRPVWQIDYDKYGSYSHYQKIKNMYWKISSHYIDTEGRYNVINFPLSGYDPEETRLLKEFRKDINVPITER